LRTSGAIFVLAVAGVSVGCRNDMHDQPRYKPLHESDFFADHRSARPQVEGTVARGHLRIDAARYTGKVGDNDVTAFRFPLRAKISCVARRGSISTARRAIAG